MTNRKQEFDLIETFPPLGHPEHHFNKYPNHPWLKTKDEIKDWILKHDDYCMSIEGYVINDDLTVTKNTTLNIVKINKVNEEVVVPIMFRSLEGYYIKENVLGEIFPLPYNTNVVGLSSNKVSSLKGLSVKTKDEFSIYANENLIEDFEGFKVETKKLNIVISNNPIKTFKGVENIGAEKITICVSENQIMEDERNFKECFLKMASKVNEVEVVFKSSNEALDFQNKINEIHPNIEVFKPDGQNGYRLNKDWIIREILRIESSAVLLKLEDKLSLVKKKEKKRKL